MCVYIIPYSLQIPTDDINHEDDKSVRQIMIVAGRTLSFLANPLDGLDQMQVAQSKKNH